ncbi:MAG TPA: hypothetical protein VGG28_15585 [Kofleriaceae bacterium]
MIRIDGYLLDCTISEEPVYESEVTDHPVETGSDITDNIRTKSIVYNVEAIVSDTPRGVVAQEPSRANTAGSPLPSKDAYQKLVAIQQTKKLITIISDRYGSLNNMAMLKLSPPVTKDTGRSLQFTAQFRQITFITNNRTTVRVAVPSNGPPKKSGTLPVTPNNTSAVIYVISILPQFRIAYTKTYGPPVMTRVQTNDEGTAVAQPLDCYNVNGTGARPDGYVTLGSDGLYEYTAIAKSFAATTANFHERINGTPVNYNYADNTWRDNSNNSVVKKVPPGQDRWVGVQTGPTTPSTTGS